MGDLVSLLYPVYKASNRLAGLMDNIELYLQRFARIRPFGTDSRLVIGTFCRIKKWIVEK